MIKAKQEEFDFDRRPGRPMMGTERRVSISLTMAPQVAEQLDKIAYRLGLSRSQYVEQIAIHSFANSRRDWGGCP